MRSIFQAYAQARAENPRHLAERLTESMPPRRSARP